jgi:hypothetical protein
VKVRPGTTVVPPASPSPPAAEPPSSSAALPGTDTYERPADRGAVASALELGRAALPAGHTGIGVHGGGGPADLADSLEKRRRRQGERYGTAGGGLRGLPQDGADEPASRPSLDRGGFSGHQPGHGLKINPGEAASKDGHKPHKPHKPPSEKEWNQQLLKDTKKLIKEGPNYDPADPYWKKHAADPPPSKPVPDPPPDPASNPGPDGAVGTWVPKHGPADPYSDRMRRPHVPRPLADPRVEENEPSLVMKGRDQAVDPNPDADPDQGGSARSILSTADAVTDPLPDIDSAGRQGR